MKAGKILIEASGRLAGCGVEEPGLNAQWLLADAMGVPRLNLLADPDLPVSAAALRKFKKGLALKEQGEPLAYILGWQDFRGLRINVDKRVLVPRPETEELVGLAAEFLKGRRGELAALDYGAGSGAIGFWLAKEFPGLRLTAAEKSARAIACAAGNAEALGLAKRVKFIRTATLTPVRGPFDLIVSNPPYIPTRVIPGLSPEVLSEPKVALDGGGDGLDVARMLVKLSPARLKKGGALLLELGGSQAKNLAAAMPAAVWKETKTFKDLNGIERFVFGRIHG
ncbi:MAG: protein-(glutamine-N5) methyltransferase, release factor-specific [Elusimicrobia bacterium GWA2_61_42]|nr:MAG: protein-(glutamine-N5) methyltransferase, release factor-specific [Elusimicrobia bacterium GWA2_61_42]OGR77483.1 MAG: protein-(glutamine-N5) methyltransferase, release factor-specific [Elusimicrobia bacterium GWC2_61_25]